MPNYIAPSFSLSANASTSTNLPGPMSFALNLTIADSLNVDYVEQKLVTTSDTTTQLLDGHDVMTLHGSDAWTPGTIGCYIYLKNNSSTTGDNIYMSIVPTHVASNTDTMTGTDSPVAPTGLSELDLTTNVTLRTFTLLPGEFAWFPFDYTGDIYWKAASGKTPKLEYWRFDKGA